MGFSPLLRKIIMKSEFIRFGEITLDGESFTKDVVITQGRIMPRDKKPSKEFRVRFDHTPLSIKEAIPWECKRLIIGTGAEGRLPIMKRVYAEAVDKGIELIVVPTQLACKILSEADLNTTNAILHVTC
jgi:hypothetical protein